MRTIAPRTGAPEVTIGEEQEEFLPVTVALYENNGAPLVLTRWTLTADERKRVGAGEDIYIAQRCDSTQMTPLHATVGPAEWQR